MTPPTPPKSLIFPVPLNKDDDFPVHPDTHQVPAALANGKLQHTYPGLEKTEKPD